VVISKLSLGVRQVLKRPLLWALRYALVTVPAVLIVPLVMDVLTAWFRRPLFVDALASRSLDLLADVLMHGGGELTQPGLLVVALFLVPALWLGVRFVWLFLEGGVLLSYAQRGAPRWRQFLRASWRWWGRFLLIGGVRILLAVAVVALGIGVGVILRLLGQAGEIPIAVVALLTIGVLGVWCRTARVVSVVREERHIFRALAAATSVFRTQGVQLIGIVVVVLALRLLLVLGSEALVDALPISTWALAVLIQQGVQVLLVGLSLVQVAAVVSLVGTAEEPARPQAQDLPLS
jgi:hypothetical protein